MKKILMYVTMRLVRLTEKKEKKEEKEKEFDNATARCPLITMHRMPKRTRTKMRKSLQRNGLFEIFSLSSPSDFLLPFRTLKESGLHKSMYKNMRKEKQQL